MMKPRIDAKLRWLGLVLVGLTVVLVTLFAALSPSATASQARVGDRTSEAKVFELHGGMDADRRLGSRSPMYECALVAGVAAEIPATNALALAPECNYDGAAPIYDASVRGVDARAVPRVEQVGPQATVVPLRSQSGAALEGSVAVSGSATAAKPAVGFAKGLGETALTSGRLQHGTKNLVDAGVLPAWSGKNSPGIIRRALTPILEHPSATFDHALGGTSVRGFLGDIDGQQIAAFVYKEGPYQGQLASSSVPSANQLKMWGVAP